MITTRTPILLHYRLKIDDKSNENEIRRQQIQQQKAGEAGTAKSQYAVIARFLVPESRAVITEIYYKHAAKSLGDVADVFFRIDPKPGLTLQKNLRTLTIDGVLPLCIQGKTHIGCAYLPLDLAPVGMYESVATIPFRSPYCTPMQLDGSSFRACDVAFWGYPPWAGHGDMTGSIVSSSCPVILFLARCCCSRACRGVTSVLLWVLGPLACMIA